MDSMSFTYTSKVCSYCSVFVYTNNRRNIVKNRIAILDTGATRSSMSIKALSKLTGYDENDIRAVVNNWVQSNITSVREISTANGIVTGIPTLISNVCIDTCKFEKFYFTLRLCDKDSDVVDDNSHMILIGLDVIRQASSVVIDSSKAIVNDFSYDSYIENRALNIHSHLSLFQALENNIKFT